MSQKERIPERYVYPRQCPGCQRLLHAGSFGSKGIYKGMRVRENYCKDCLKFMKAETPARVLDDADEVRQCNRCLRTQPMSEFSPCGTWLQYRRRVCNTCLAPHRRAVRIIYYMLNRETILVRARAYRLARKHGHHVRQQLLGRE